MKEVLTRLKEHQSTTPSKWKEKAEWRLQNKSWLRHSQRIAMKMLEKMDGRTGADPKAVGRTNGV